MRVLSILPVVAGFPSLAPADVVTLPASKDNTLSETSDGSLSDGAGRHFFAGRTDQSPGDDVRRGLLEFDVAGAIPPGSVIHSAALELHMSKTQAGPEDVSLHRALAEWGEGASDPGGGEGSGASSEAGDATWLHTFYPGSFWVAEGGDFNVFPSATTSVDRDGTYRWESPASAADVQAWLDAPASNHGWVVVGDEGVDKSAKRFDGRSIGDASKRPRLIVQFTPGSSGGACCFADGSCLEISEEDCTDLGGVYQGDGTSCFPDPCPDPVGACCFPDGSCAELTEVDCTAAGGAYNGDGTACAPELCPLVLEKYVDALPIPRVANPVGGTIGGAADYDVAITEFQQQLHRDLPPTTVWGYDGSYPGPTIEAGRDALVRVRWINDLRDGSGTLRSEHLLPVDTCLHGPATEGNTPRTVVHVHGAHVRAEFDGYPEATILPGEEATYEYENHQLPATLWYHDHALGITRLNVILGLAGFYLLRDPLEQGLGLPAGEFEIPLAIQDRTFRADGSFEYPAAWQDEFFGDTILVNGKAWPYLEVKRGKYRFRVLDGSNSRTYTLSLSTGDPFQQIGTEGGLLPAPLTTTEVTISPGERVDLVIDFEGYAPRTEVFLQNSAPAPFPGSPGVGVVPDVMKFVVLADTGHTDEVPAELRSLEELLESAAVQHRDFLLRKDLTDPCTGFRWLIDGLGWDDVTEFPYLDTLEVWSFANSSNMVHPMHMHLVTFQVLDRQAFQLIGDEIVPVGERIPVPPSERGWKDTVRAMPEQITRVIARFEDYAGLYPYHCHILEHEDHEMMRQFHALADPGDPYCYGVGCPCGNDHPQAGCVDSTGAGAVLWAAGTSSVAADDLALTAFNVPPGQFGIYFMGGGQIQLPFGDGLRCVGSGGRGIFRFLPPRSSGATGVLTLGPGIVAHTRASFAPAGQIDAGDTWNFQAWFRDPAGPCGSAFNLSNAVAVGFTP